MQWDLGYDKPTIALYELRDSAVILKNSWSKINSKYQILLKIIKYSIFIFLKIRL